MSNFDEYGAFNKYTAPFSMYPSNHIVNFTVQSSGMQKIHVNYQALVSLNGKQSNYHLLQLNFREL